VKFKAVGAAFLFWWGEIWPLYRPEPDAGTTVKYLYLADGAERDERAPTQEEQSEPSRTGLLSPWSAAPQTEESTPQANSKI